MTTGLGRRPGAAVADRAERETGVLIVDDSSVVRRLLTRVIDAEPGFRVVGEAGDGQRAISLTKALQPDMIVLDLAMPIMDGYETLAALRAEHLEVRVVVFANVESDDVERVSAIVRAAGADLVVKPTGVVDAAQAMEQVRGRLIGPLRRNQPAERPAPRPVSPRPKVLNAVVVASSTGGPNALEDVFSSIDELRVPVFVVQHIAGSFSGRLADQLDHVSRFPVSEATDGEHPEPGRIYISPGGIHLSIERRERSVVMRLRDLPPVNSCRPSADVLFLSSAEVYGGNQLAVVLTGIGQDGLEGCRELSRLGASVVVQDQKSSVVWGMPGAVANAGLADEVLPLSKIGPRVERLTALGPPRSRRPRGEG